MKFNMIFKFLKENFLHLLGYSTLLVMIIVLCGRACTAEATIKKQEAVINDLIQLREQKQKKPEEEKKEIQEIDTMVIKREEYPIATKVWEFLGAYGYNDWVKAGILGNMMAECGGQTLNLQVDAYNEADKGYYGLCQWSLKYTPQLNKTDLITQLQYLVSSMKQEFNNYGKNYAYDFNYNSFINLNNEKEAALAFAKCYERCSSGSYITRQCNAEFAYNYYTS